MAKYEDIWFSASYTKLHALDVASFREPFRGFSDNSPQFFWGVRANLSTPQPILEDQSHRSLAGIPIEAKDLSQQSSVWTAPKEVDYIKEVSNSQATTTTAFVGSFSEVRKTSGCTLMRGNNKALHIQLKQTDENRETSTIQNQPANTICYYIISFCTTACNC